MTNGFAIYECKRTANGGEPREDFNDVHPSMEAAMQAYIDDPATPTDWDRASFGNVGPNRTRLFVEYTE